MIVYGSCSRLKWKAWPIGGDKAVGKIEDGRQVQVVRSTLLKQNSNGDSARDNCFSVVIWIYFTVNACAKDLTPLAWYIPDILP